MSILTQMLIASLGVSLGCAAYAESAKHPSPAHRRTEFTFVVNAPSETVTPLFGADKERLWADGWDPQFVHPQPANDEAGAVFTIKSGHSNVWINTIYDLERGHVQYACFAAKSMVTLIDIHVERIGADKTKAVVVYERTALQPEAIEHVNRLADGDKTKGPEWERAFHTHLHNRAKKEAAAK